MAPPYVARAIAEIHTAIYDAWANYDANAVGTQLGGLLRTRQSEWTLDNKNTALSYAAYDVALDLFPSQKAFLDLELSSLGYDSTDRSTGTTSPAAIGHAVARAIINFRHNDGSNQLNGYADTTGYIPVNTPTELNDATAWQPLAIPDGHGGTQIQKFLGAQWGLVTPFSLTSGSQWRPVVTLPKADSAAYAEQAAELLSYSALLTDTQKMIAEYWADNTGTLTPPGHWLKIAQFVSRRDNHSVDDDAKMFFAVANAELDASIAAWDTKRAYNSVRPITVIRYLYAGKLVKAWAGPGNGTQFIDGSKWEPYQAANVVTPPFPEYVSGHSTFSAASAEVLKRFTGSDLYGESVTFTAGSSTFEPGKVPAADVTLSWSTFTDAANEAGLSRRYGGIHFPQGDLDGRAMGRQVGVQVYEKALSYINGTLGRNL